MGLFVKIHARKSTLDGSRWLFVLLLASAAIGIALTAILATIGGTSLDLNAYVGVALFVAAAVVAAIIALPVGDAS